MPGGIESRVRVPSHLKNELIHHQPYHTREEAGQEIFACSEEFYNRQRLSQNLGHLSPLEFERREGEP
ncbi:MAG: IS3 family transposase [Nitrospira sp. BO4]|jgi:transposase InsO family protein|nr:IS3 family transposase [Nitrospira sp. BO4]